MDDTTKPAEKKIPWGPLFHSNVLTNERAVILADTRVAFVHLAEHLEKELPDGRYKSMVLTKLEEAAMLATKSLSHTHD